MFIEGESGHQKHGHNSKNWYSHCHHHCPALAFGKARKLNISNGNLNTVTYFWYQCGQNLLPRGIERLQTVNDLQNDPSIWKNLAVWSNWYRTAVLLNYLDAIWQKKTFNFGEQKLHGVQLLRSTVLHRKTTADSNSKLLNLFPLFEDNRGIMVLVSEKWGHLRKNI